ncbi:hypothetical protein U8C43_24450 [Sinorhizobium meliloti]|nr:hypothetical protein U8C30_24485 [Sinorhizobium meliloti]WQP29013.1 hypothetical protein U8C43_24450 [Sinorhizobium meliloti]
MRFAVSLSLAAIGVSFLLPSDGYKAALFIACAALAFVVMGEEEPELADHPEISFAGDPENADEAAYDVSAEDEDSYEREYETDRHFSRH